LYCPVEGDTEPDPDGLMLTLRVYVAGFSGTPGVVTFSACGAGLGSPQALSKRMPIARIDPLFHTTHLY